MAVATGSAHTCALLQTGGVRCWGGNTFGQLGDGTMTSRAVPGADVLTGVIAVATGFDHTCVIVGGATRGSGGVRCWGSNTGGQLGDGTTTNRASPPATDVVSDATAIVAGQNHTCALRASGRITCWGAGNTGALGNGSTVNVQASPVDTLSVCP
jgi:alpha-tubulin suppressor-like RCC1 family protein